MVRQIGDTMLGGTGFALVIILAATVLIALVGTTLACLNTGVRITYVMGRDKEVPGILGMLHFKHATPHYGVIALALISAVLGGYAVLSADNLLQITLASNTGTFLVYGMTCGLVLVAFGGEHKRHVVKHVIVPLAGLLANIGMLIGIVVMSVSAGGSTQTDTLIALGIVAAWIIAGAVWLLLNSAANQTSLLVKPPVISPEL
jgi:amino acid transporter